MALVRIADPRRGVLVRRKAMRRGLAGAAFVSGIPDSPECGVNPCGFTDIIGPSPECVSFVQCADPSDFSSWLKGKGGLVPSLAAQAGSDVSSTVNEAIDAFFSSAVNPAPTGSGVNWLIIGGIAAAVLFLPRLLKA